MGRCPVSAYADPAFPHDHAPHRFPDQERRRIEIDGKEFPYLDQLTSTHKITVPLFIEFLKSLIVKYPKKIFLIVDGPSTHKAKAVERYLKTVKDHLRL
jgi:hypothetical protein